MTDPRKTDERLKNIFSALPRAGAPDDFEERLRRKLALRAAGGPRLPRRFVLFAIPALSLVVVGTLSVLVYMTRFGAGEDVRSPSEGVPVASPSVVSPPGDSLRSGSPGVASPGIAPRSGAGAGDAPVSRLPEVRESIGTGQGGPGAVRPDAKAADEFRAKNRTVPGVFKAEQERTVGVSLSDSDAPAGSVVSADSGLVPDSLAVSDSVLTDSLHRRTDTAAVSPEPVREGGPPHR